METAGTATDISTATIPSLADMLETIREFEKTAPKPEVDVFVLTYQQYTDLTSHDEVVESHGPNSLLGIPFEKYHTRSQVLLRAMEFHRSGKRVGVIE